MEYTDGPQSEKPPKRRCKNCDGKLSRSGEFCPHCGQKDFDGRVRMRDLLTKFFTNLTHLDGKFVKMCWHLLIPAKVTIEYFQGRIKRYPHPVQFFFIVMFFFLLSFSGKFNGARLDSTNGNFSLRVGGEDTTMNKELVRILSSKGLMELLGEYELTKKYRTNVDSLPKSWQTPEVRLAVDSLVNKVDGPLIEAAQYLISGGNGIKRDSVTGDSIYLSMLFTGLDVATKDLVELSPDSILKLYNVTSWGDKIMLRQGIKSLHDPKTLVKTYVGSFAWTILVLIALMSLLLYLMYWKSGKYYVEHFIFTMHQQSGAFMLLTILFVFNDYIVELDWLGMPVIGWIGLSLLLAMKRFYRQSWLWTVLKWMVFCALYLLLMVLVFVATLLLVIVLF
ncbi:MAG TPA: DUF3667 domain-containing protein [Saprospiraceae bacterium]|nr:DUF3667 domain-containing protein [Saprospiraceae bacterium]